ncbi:MAG: hypothetical protein HUJ52_01135 [Malacoplasma sp.]|nr:hypothetical protein [Malacoplasma sp.]
MAKKKKVTRKAPKNKIAGHKAAYTRQKVHHKNSVTAFHAAKKRAVDSALRDMGVSPKKYWAKQERRKHKRNKKK